MSLLNRKTLKEFFRKGKFPSEVHFADLIDSTVNMIDDGFRKTDEEGLQLAPTGGRNRLISFFKNITDTHPLWQFSFQGNSKIKGLNIEKVDLDVDGNPEVTPILSFHNNGNMGIKAESPRFPLEVGGALGMHTRIGTYANVSVNGDGKWHRVTDILTGVQAFEVVARIDGPEGRGKYALLHAIALSTHGRGWRRIRRTRAFSGMPWDRIQLKWKRNKEGFYLRMRTRSPYPDNAKIQCHITSLWSDFPATYMSNEKS